jgi:UPF0755 protein
MFLKLIKTGFALGVIVLFLILVWLAVGLNPPQKLPSERVFFDVEKGMGISAVARALKEKGLIRARFPFVISYHLFFYPQKIKAGEYAFSSPLRAKDILDMLIKGKVYLHAVTIPEGLTAQEIAPLVFPLLSDGEDGYRAAFQNTEAISSLDQEAKNLEGYLFPETYSFPKGISSKEAAETMVAEFMSVFDETQQSRARALRMTVRKIVILASLIEKETSVPEEKRLVSAVFHNRLRSGMKLDCDPSIIYVLKQEGRYEGRLRKKDMSYDSPYNTYLHAGLPPGPICNPGKEALEAALYPAPENYFYFVSKNDGSHHFSRTFAEHQNAVGMYQKNNRRRKDGDGSPGEPSP